MAEIPTVDGPRAQQSGAGTSSATIPGAFGADVATKGLGELSQASEQVSTQFAQTAERIQQLHNDAVVAQHSMDAFDKGTQLTNAYRQLSLNAAVAAYPKYRTDLEGVVTQGGQGLPPAALPQYLQQTRRFALGQLEAASTHASTEANKYLIGTATAAATMAGNAYAANPNPENEAAMHAAVGNYLKTTGEFSGLDPNNPKDQPLLALDTQKFYSPAYSTAIANMVQRGDLNGAQALFNAHKGDLDDQSIRSLGGAMATKVNASNVANVANAALHGGTTQATTNPDLVWNNMIHVESGGRPGVSGPETPYGVAHGLTQVLDTTGAKMAAKLGVPWQPELMRGTSPAAAAYQQAIGHAYYEEGLAKYNGNTYKAAEYYHGGPDERLWGPKTVAYANKVTGGAPGVQLQGVPMPNVNTNPDQYLADAETRLAENARVAYPNDIEQQQKVIAYGLQMAHREVAPIDAQQKATYDAMATAVQNGHMSTVTDLQAAFPAQWAALPAKYQGALEREVNFVGNIPTADNTANADHVRQVLDTGDLAAIQALSIRTMDLRTADKGKFVARQQEIEAHGWKADPVSQVIMKSPEMTQALQATKFLIEPDGKNVTDTQQRGYSIAKSQFQGAVLGELDAWRGANPGKAPTRDDVNHMIADVTARNGHGQFLALPPLNIKQDIVASYTAKWGAVPTEGQIAALYAHGRAAGKVKYGQ